MRLLLIRKGDSCGISFDKKGFYKYKKVSCYNVLNGKFEVLFYKYHRFKSTREQKFYPYDSIVINDYMFEKVSKNKRTILL